jgi:hypothetical protein
MNIVQVLYISCGYRNVFWYCTVSAWYAPFNSGSNILRLENFSVWQIPVFRYGLLIRNQVLYTVY